MRILSSSLILTVLLGTSPAIAIPLTQTNETFEPASENTNCLIGYPDGTFRNDAPVTRFEFAAGLNACFSQVEQQLTESVADKATQSDFQALTEQLNRLREQLGSLQERVDEQEVNSNEL